MTNLVTLPTAEQSANIALACAGLAGHPRITDAISRAGGAMELLEHVHDDPAAAHLPDEFVERIRRCGTPAIVARVLEATRRAGLRLVSPGDAEWPAGLRDLGRSQPRLLWMTGARHTGSDRPIALTGGLHPTPGARRHLLEVAVALLDLGYQVATSLREGVDRLVVDAAIATEGRALLVAHNPESMQLWRDHPRITIVCENPPVAPLGTRSARRAHALLAVLAQRVLVVDAPWMSPAVHTGIAATALGRPLAVLAGAVAEGDDRLRREFSAREIQFCKDLLRLS